MRVDRNGNPLIADRPSTEGAKQTPSRKDLREKLAALVDAKEDMLVVDVLETHYGTPDLKGTARVYKDAKELKKTELSYIVKRNFPEKKAEAEAIPAPPAPTKK